MSDKKKEYNDYFPMPSIRKILPNIALYQDNPPYKRRRKLTSYSSSDESDSKYMTKEKTNNENFYRNFLKKFLEEENDDTLKLEQQTLGQKLNKSRKNSRKKEQVSQRKESETKLSKLIFERMIISSPKRRKQSQMETRKKMFNNILHFSPPSPINKGIKQVESIMDKNNNHKFTQKNKGKKRLNKLEGKHYNSDEVITNKAMNKSMQLLELNMNNGDSSKGFVLNVKKQKKHKFLGCIPIC